MIVNAKRWAIQVFTALAATAPPDEINESGIKIDTNNTKVNIDKTIGMAGVYSLYDSSVTLAGTPVKTGEHKISVTITDDQGRTATSNELIFKVYSGDEILEEQLI